MMAVFAKTDKALMLHFIMEDHVKEQYPKSSMFIQVGNALFHTLNNLPPTFGGICLQILDHMAAKQTSFFLQIALTKTPSKFRKEYVVDAESNSFCRVSQQESQNT